MPGQLTRGAFCPPLGKQPNLLSKYYKHATLAPVGPPPTTMKCSARRTSASNAPGSAASSKQSEMRFRSAIVSAISCGGLVGQRSCTQPHRALFKLPTSGLRLHEQVVHVLSSTVSC